MAVSFRALRHVVALATPMAMSLGSLGAQAPGWPGERWPTAPLESERLDPAPWTSLDADIRAGAFGHVDHMLVIRHGRAVFDRRYSRDYREISRGRVSAIGCGEGCPNAAAMHEFNYFHPNWHPFYQGRDIHTLQSVTKSVAATIVGLALGDGHAQALDQPFLPFFKERDLSRVDSRLHRATLDHLLTMRSGIEWHEQDRPLDETNTTVQLEASRDWIAFTLSQPMDADPGAKWAYNSGGSQLLSGIVRAAAGRHIDEYANERLFRPIGIRDVHWKKTPTGHPDTEGGLYLSASDLARIGYLYLRDGMWAGRRILPAGWVARATTRHAKAVAPGWDYGYQWWLTSRGGVDIWAGRGFGGQLLIVIPSRDLIGVVLAWNVFGDRVRGLQTPFIDALIAGSAPR